jgi:hypothetical protein
MTALPWQCGAFACLADVDRLEADAITKIAGD